MRRRAPMDRPLQKPGAARVRVLLSRVLRDYPTPAEVKLWSASNRRVLYRLHEVLTVLAHRCADREALLPPVCGGKVGMGGREAR